MVEKIVNCPHCGKANLIMVSKENEWSDLGGMRCTNCAISWCQCIHHGVYPCPPPCQLCREEDRISQKNDQG